MANVGQACSLLFTILTLLAQIACLVIICICYVTAIYFSHDFPESLGYNWSLSPILSIQAVPGSACPTGTTNLLQDNWPGTNAGCSCSAEMKLDACNAVHDLGCSDVAPINKRSYQKWDGYSICATTDTKTYLDLSIIDASGSCPSSSPVLCGKIDSLGNILCATSTTNCPINDIQFISKTSAVPSGYTSVSLNTKNLIYSKSVSTGNILVQTKISDEQPCSITNQQNYYGGSAYILDYFYANATCTTSVDLSSLDMAYTKLDTFSYETLLNDNNILTTLLTTIPTYPSTRYAHDTSLYYKNYIGLKPSCRSALMSTMQMGNANIWYDLLKNAKNNAILYPHVYNNWISCIVSTAVTLIWAILNFHYKGGHWETTRSKTEAPFIISIIFSILVFFGTVCNVSFFFAFSTSTNNFGDLAPFNNLTGCMDTKSEELLLIFLNQVNDYKTFSLYVGGILSIIILAGVVLLHT